MFIKENRRQTLYKKFKMFLIIILNVVLILILNVTYYSKSANSHTIPYVFTYVLCLLFVSCLQFYSSMSLSVLKNFEEDYSLEFLLNLTGIHSILFS